MTTHYMKAEGGLHQRVWFAKAGRGIAQDTGISPTAEQHLKNGTYSFSLAAFNPAGMDQKAATEEGKASSLYKGMGAQFGAQIWRMAFEATPGDYIFLESENHNLHAVGVITGPYRTPATSFDDGSLQREGIHAIPVRWTPIAHGDNVIQLGRLDNAVFRNVIEKEELLNLLLELTQPYMSKGLYTPGEFDRPAKAVAQVASKAVAEVIPPPPPPEALTTPLHISRDGGYIYQNIDDAKLKRLIQAKEVVGTDYYFRHGMKTWMRVSQYALAMGIAL